MSKLTKKELKEIFQEVKEVMINEIKGRYLENLGIKPLTPAQIKKQLKKQQKAIELHQKNVEKVKKYAEKLNVDLYTEFGSDY